MVKKPSTGFMALLVTPFLVSLPRALEAQAAAPPKGGRQSESGPPFNLEFRGGKLIDYVELLRGLKPEELNIIVGPEVGGLEMQPVSLKNVSLRSALMLIPQLYLEKGIRAELRPVDRGGGAEVYVLSLLRKREAPRALEVFSIRELTQPDPGGTPTRPALNPQTILTAVDTALGLNGLEGAEKPVIKLHQESHLLVVSGTPEQTGIVGRVLTEMSRTASREGASAEVQDLRAAVKKLEEEVAKLKSQVAELKG